MQQHAEGLHMLSERAAKGDPTTRANTLNLAKRMGVHGDVSASVLAHDKGLSKFARLMLEQNPELRAKVAVSNKWIADKVTSGATKLYKDKGTLAQRLSARVTSTKPVADAQKKLLGKAYDALEAQGGKAHRNTSVRAGIDGVRAVVGKGPIAGTKAMAETFKGRFG